MEATLMLLSDVFEQFVQDSPVPVMVRGLLENTLSPRFLDEMFEDVAERQYTRKLLFSSVVDLMGSVVNRIQPAVNSAYHARAETIGVALKSVYNKLDNVEPDISAAMVRATAERLETVVTTMGGALPPLLPGYRVKILDGNHLASTEHRIKELRTMRAGALPGQALAVLDPSLMLVIDVVLCEDGHAQERSLLDQVLETVGAKDVWIDDRNFCTTGFLFGIAGHGAFFVVRQHASTLHWEFVGKKRARGRIETGKVFEQTVRLSDPDTGEILFTRRVTVALDKPTRDGDREIHILTNLPKKVANARTIADLYRKRWTIETAFQELEATLNGEINTLGYPKAALFAFCVALVSYNLMSVVKAALRAVYGEQTVQEKVSGYYLANEVTRIHDGMMIAIPEDEWVVFHGLTPVEMGEVLVDLARRVRLERYPKQPHGPKKPKPEKQSGAKIKHVATAKILNDRHKCTK
jgi:IS4 transposase